MLALSCTEVMREPELYHEGAGVVVWILVQLVARESNNRERALVRGVVRETWTR